MACPLTYDSGINQRRRKNFTINWIVEMKLKTRLYGFSLHSSSKKRICVIDTWTTVVFSQKIFTRSNHKQFVCWLCRLNNIKNFPIFLNTYVSIKRKLLHERKTAESFNCSILLSYSSFVSFRTRSTYFKSRQKVGPSQFHSSLGHINRCRRFLQHWWRSESIENS